MIGFLSFNQNLTKCSLFYFKAFFCVKLPSDDVESMLSYINGFISEMRNYLLLSSSCFKTRTHTHSEAHTHKLTQTQTHINTHSHNLSHTSKDGHIFSQQISLSSINKYIFYKYIFFHNKSEHFHEQTH